MDAFTLMKVAGHSSVTVSQRYGHPSTGAIERAIEKLQGGEPKIEEAAEDAVVA